MICLVAQANIPLPVLALPLYIITKILDASRFRRALLTAMKGIICPVPLSFRIPGQIRTTSPAAPPWLYIHLVLVNRDSLSTFSICAETQDPTTFWVGAVPY